MTFDASALRSHPLYAGIWIKPPAPIVEEKEDKPRLTLAPHRKFASTGRRGPSRTFSSYDPEVIASVLDLHGQRMSYANIGQRLGLTRNNVVNIVNQLRKRGAAA